MANTIKSLRLTNKYNFMSQSELAKQIGVSRQTIVNIEKGKVPSLTVAKQIADFFGESVDSIFFNQSGVPKHQKGNELNHENQTQ